MENYQVSFPQPVTTKGIRIMDVKSGGGNPLVFEIYAYALQSCPLPAGI